MPHRRALLCLILLVLSLWLRAQDVGEVETKRITVKELNGAVFLNTCGLGIGVQQGRTPNYYDKHFWEIDFLYNIHPKTVLAKNPYYEGARVFTYGKMNDLFFLRLGYGYQRTLSQKPYWGGVRIRYTLSAGFSLGLALPVYVYIATYYSLDGLVDRVSERYDYTQHNLDNIIGRASFFQGLSQTTFHPGFYLKSGVSFDFSQDEYSIHAIEVGVTLDVIFPSVQQMAYNKAKNCYLTAYLAYNFGKRKGNYE